MVCYVHLFGIYKWAFCTLTIMTHYKRHNHMSYGHMAALRTELHCRRCVYVCACMYVCKFECPCVQTVDINTVQIGSGSGWFEVSGREEW